MKRLLVGSGAATVAVVVWGMVFWGFLYDPLGVFRDLPPGAERVAQALQEAGTETGTYFFPWPRNTPEARALWVKRHSEAPFFRLSYVAQGINPDSPGKIGLGVLHSLLLCVLAALLLRLTLAALPTFGRRLGVVVLAGSLGTLLIRAGDPIWYHMPWHFALGNAAYEIGFWVIGGAVLAALIKPA